MVIRLAIHFDGLLERFGRPSAAGVSMLARMEQIGARLRASPRNDRLDLRIVRFQENALDPAAEAVRELARDLLKPETEGIFHPFADSVAVAPDGETLARLLQAEGPGSDSRAILLSASRYRVAEALASGLAAFHIREFGSPGERWLPPGEAPRMVEEALRMPTARPMARGVRSGSLLAIGVDNPAEARTRALEAIRVDARADWVTMGDTLVLYTEDADLEDRLVEESNVELLATDVRQDDLSILSADEAGRSKALYRTSGFDLHLGASEREDIPEGRTRRLGWDRARRRVFGWTRRESSMADPRLLETIFAERLQILQSRLETVLGAEAVPRARRLHAVLSRQVGVRAALDLTADAGRLRTLSWSSPYSNPYREDLVALVHDASASDPTAGRDVQLFAFALALAAGLESALSAGLIHCVRFDPATSIDALLDHLLLEEERNLVAAAVQFDGRAAGSSNGGYSLEIDPALEERMGGNGADMAGLERVGVAQEGRTPRLRVRGTFPPAGAEAVAPLLPLLLRIANLGCSS